MYEVQNTIQKAKEANKEEDMTTVDIEGDPAKESLETDLSQLIELYERLSSRCAISGLEKLPSELKDEQEKKERLRAELKSIQQFLIILYLLATILWTIVVLVFSFFKPIRVFETSFVGLIVLIIFGILAFVQWIFMWMCELETFQQWVASVNARGRVNLMFLLQCMEGNTKKDKVEVEQEDYFLTRSFLSRLYSVIFGRSREEAVNERSPLLKK